MRPLDKESKNFEDVSMQSPFEGLLRYMLTPNLRDGAPGGHAKWLTDTLSKLTPNDLMVMKANGFTAEEMLRFKMKLAEVNEGNLSHIPAEAYPYNDAWGKKLIDYQKNLKNGYHD
jgi:hypothetical protein